MAEAPPRVAAPRPAADCRVANSLGLACRAAACLDVGDASALQAALAWCTQRGLRPLPLGAGSNVLLPERLPRAVLRSSDDSLRELACDRESVRLRVGAGRDWHRLVVDCLQREYFGLENLALIPGTVGAAPVQNIGAYGVELASFVEAVHGVDLDSGEARQLAPQDCAFAYRDSVFKGALRQRFMITAVDLRLLRQPRLCLDYPSLARRVEQGPLPPTPYSVFDAVVAIRRERLPDPRQLPNAGSFFTNPLVSAAQAAALRARYPELPAQPQGDGRCKLSAAWMIERCGLRGARRGGAGVAAQHALVLVNHGATRAELLRLAEEVRAAVRARFGCDLGIEPQVIDGE